MEFIVLCPPVALGPPQAVTSEVLTTSQQQSIDRVTINIRVLKVSMVTLIIDSCCDFVKTSYVTPCGGPNATGGQSTINSIQSLSLLGPFSDSGQPPAILHLVT